MTDNIVLTFPKGNCKEIVIKGLPFVQVDVGMSADQLILYLMKYSASEEKMCAVVKKDE